MRLKLLVSFFQMELGVSVRGVDSTEIATEFSTEMWHSRENEASEGCVANPVTLLHPVRTLRAAMT